MESLKKSNVESESKLEKMRNDLMEGLNKNMAKLEKKIVTSNNNKIQDLENLNTDLKDNLEETTEILNDVKSEIATKDQKIESLEKSKVESESKLEKNAYII